MDALSFDVDEFYNQLPVDDPDMKAYIQAVGKYENVIEELRGALPVSQMHDIVKVFSEMSLIEIKLAYRQGMRAGCVCAGAKKSGDGCRTMKAYKQRTGGA